MKIPSLLFTMEFIFKFVCITSLAVKFLHNEQQFCWSRKWYTPSGSSGNFSRNLIQARLSS